MHVFAQMIDRGAEALLLGAAVIDMGAASGTEELDLIVHARAILLCHGSPHGGIIDGQPSPVLLVRPVGGLQGERQTLLDDRPRNRPLQIEAPANRAGRGE